LFTGAQIVTEGFTVPGVHPTPEVPVPLSATVCGDDESESLKESVPDRAPKTVGVNCTLIVQLPPAARLLPQLLLCVKSPLTVMDVIVRAFVELRVTGCAELEEPTTMLPKLSDEGVTVTPDETPLTVTDCLKSNPVLSFACTVSR
jgi:hypothetical protein